MRELPDRSVHLMVTSPPYNAGKAPDEYRAFLKRVMAEVYRVPVPGGRACIHVANPGRRPYLPLHAFIIEDMPSLGFLWDKAASASPSTAWGSRCSPANPTLRDTVFCKQTFTRPNPYGRAGTIGRDEERLALPGGACRQGGTSGPLSGGAALSPTKVRSSWTPSSGAEPRPWPPSRPAATSWVTILSRLTWRWHANAWLKPPDYCPCPSFLPDGGRRRPEGRGTAGSVSEKVDPAAGHPTCQGDLTATIPGWPAQPHGFIMGSLRLRRRL